VAQLDQLQLVVAEVQAARQQVSSVRAQVQELEGTIAAVESQPDDMALHRQMGGVLIEVADRVALLGDLNETLASLKVHLQRFTEREQQLIKTYDELKQSLQGAQEWAHLPSPCRTTSNGFMLGSSITRAKAPLP